MKFIKDLFALLFVDLVLYLLIFHIMDPKMSSALNTLLFVVLVFFVIFTLSYIVKSVIFWAVDHDDKHNVDYRMDRLEDRVHALELKEGVHTNSTKDYRHVVTIDTGYKDIKVYSKETHIVGIDEMLMDLYPTVRYYLNVGGIGDPIIYRLHDPLSEGEFDVLFMKLSKIDGIEPEYDDNPSRNPYKTIANIELGDWGVMSVYLESGMPSELAKLRIESIMQRLAIPYRVVEAYDTQPAWFKVEDRIKSATFARLEDRIRFIPGVKTHMHG